MEERPLLGDFQPWRVHARGIWLLFWWRDTVGYKRVNDNWVASNGSSSNFSFSEENTPTYGKNNSTLKSQGWIDSNYVLVPAHDAARVHRGGNWRIPTRSELNSLISKCTWTLTTMNSVKGYIIKGKDNYAASSIFIPFTGYGYGTSRSEATSLGDYWLSIAGSDWDYGTAWSLFIDSSNHNLSSDRRYINGRQSGLVIRPVRNADW